MKYTFILCWLLLTISSYGRGLDNAFQLLPQPQSIETLPGKGLHHHELKFVEPGQGVSVPVLGAMMGSLAQAKRPGKGVMLVLSENNIPDSKEGYVLELNHKGVTITARDEAGLFYGCRTLEQLMEDSRDFGKEIPAMRITDYPDIAYRAVHFDTKHHLSRMEYYYRSIDRLARYKINAVIWEIEDKLRYTRRPEVGAPNAISKQEMQALCRYAKERNIEISPLVQGLGHAPFILKHHWELRENPESDWEFCPSDPRTYEVLFDLYMDAFEAMPYGKYLHVGGDEITAIGIDERCKATGKSAFELQMVWLQKVCKFAVEHGRTPIFWDDMPLKYSGLWTLINSDATEEELDKIWNTQKLDTAIDLFPKECLYMRWYYGDASKPGNKRIVDWYSKKGLKVIGATAAAVGGSPFLPRGNSRIDYIKAFNEVIADNRLTGILATAWDDGSPHSETVWRGFIAQGEYGWNAYDRSLSAFSDAHVQREFGFNPADSLFTFLRKLEQTAFFFDGALITQGRRNPAWGTKDFTLMNLPDKEKPGEWNVMYQEKVEKARDILAQQAGIETSITGARNHALRNRYTLEIYEQTYHLLVYPAQILVALSDYDRATDDAARKTALDKIAEVCRYFSTMRKNLEDVYSQSRFMQNPDGFILDMNHHNHLAAKTNNSDWWYLYEIPMVNKVKKWLTKQ